MESEDIQQENVKKIAAMFPNCVTEARDEDGHLKKAINFELLKQMLSDSVIDGDEAYEFTWVGKKASIVEANRPIRKTLRPVKEDSVNWDTTENLYIEGDNLEVLKLLQESYLGKVKMIYIDPPYNTGNDFIYNDDFKVSSEEYADGSGEVDEEGNRMFKNTNSNGRFHSDWCSMIYSRLMLSRNLLTEDGAIFISIGDDEEANLIKLCDEIFGEQNFIASICHKARASVSNDRIISENHNHLVFYAKNIDVLYAHHKEIGEDPELRGFDKVDERGRYKLTPVDGPGGARKGNPYYEFLGVTGYWRYSKETMQQKYNQGLIVSTGNNLQQKYYIDQAEKSRKTVTTWWDEDFLTSSATADFIKLMGGKYFDNPKNVNLLLRCLKMITKFDKDAIVLDFFSGSATTAHAVMQFNAEDGGERKFIMVQLPEETDEKSEAFKAGYKNICEIGKERIRRAAKKIHEDNPDATFDDGFRVLKLDDTNMKDVYYAAGAYTQGMLSSMESNVKSDRTDLDLLFGCLIDWGLPLSLPYNSETIDGCRVHTYNDGDLIACFDENVPESVFKTIAKRQPLRAVFRDSSFTSSPEKINAGETFKLLAPDTRVKVI
ncbi:site-specific DNA-methyltransferase [Bifidobacterium pseudolongum]|uniref:site-specific DNA-methyltransferase n=1 Tax=Bifidobacterium pseudolongum TaxID=1694 RepID=UPI001C588A59|nr:site-specific DNA-methyltransferase [Bifidobacterium pseudolongum]